MARSIVRLLVIPALALGVGALLTSCRGRNVPPEMEEIEWVIVDCHREGLWQQWVAKLDPRADAEVIRQLIAAINSAKWKGESESGGYGFVVFKVKQNGIRAFNFVAWFREREVEIRPGYWSRTLPKILNRMGQQRIGWDRDASLPDAGMKEIQVWQYGDVLAVLGPGSPGFAAVEPAAREVLRSTDPRASDFGAAQGDPREAAYHQRTPQFLVFFDKPADLYKLVLWHRRGENEMRVKYRSFRSSVAALCWGYVAFHSDDWKGTWYVWDTSELLGAFETMGRPDPQIAFDKLLEVYKEATKRPA